MGKTRTEYQTEIQELQRKIISVHEEQMLELNIAVRNLSELTQVYRQGHLRFTEYLNLYGEELTAIRDDLSTRKRVTPLLVEHLGLTTTFELLDSMALINDTL